VVIITKIVAFFTNIEVSGPNICGGWPQSGIYAKALRGEGTFLTYPVGTV